MMIAAHSITESIYKLCTEDRSPACFILLRPLLENYINANFLYSSPNSTHLHVILWTGFEEKKRQLEHAITFQKNQPRDTSIHHELNDLENSLKKTEKQIKKTIIYIEKHSGKKIRDTLGRAHQIDKYNKEKKLKSASLELIYILLYRHLSSSIHLNHLALTELIKRNADGTTVGFLSGNPSDIKIILELAEWLYRNILITFLTIFKSPLKAKFKKTFEVK